MNQVVAIIVALHVLAHSVVGCCAHVFAAQLPAAGCSHCHEATVGVPHEHQPEQGGHDVAEAQATPEEDVCACDGCGITEREPSPLRGHSCPHASCHWLTSGTASACGLVDFACIPAFSAPVTTVIASEAVRQLSSEFDIGRLHPLPLRLHLTVGVLLI